MTPSSWIPAFPRVLLALACGCPLAQAQSLTGFSPYHPTHPVQGTIRSWGHGFLRPVLKLWEDGFRKVQPGVNFDNRLVTSASAIAGLYTERVELGVLAREIIPPEVAAYEKITRQKLFPVTVLTGSFGNQDKIMAIGMFVNHANPVRQLTFAQLDAIWGVELKRGGKHPLRTWDELGLTGEWKGRAIHPYSGLAFEAPGYFFSQAVMKGSVLWNCALTQFDNIEDEKPPVAGEMTAPVIDRHVDAYQKAVDAVAADAGGIGLAGAGYRNPGARVLALSVADGGPYVEATRENVANGTYPLARAVKFYINSGPNLKADPATVEFLRFILSGDGQELVLKEGDFLPLTAKAAREESERLPR